MLASASKCLHSLATLGGLEDLVEVSRLYQQLLDVVSRLEPEVGDHNQQQDRGQDKHESVDAEEDGRVHVVVGTLLHKYPIAASVVLQTNKGLAFH